MIETGRKILHIDLDAFYCAVEEQRNPNLAGKPFAVGGQPHQRGVVSSCSYVARQYGVRSAMAMKLALKLCPDLIVVPPEFKDYSMTSKKVMDILHQIAPLVEQISIDEAFLDISDLTTPAETIASQLQTRIKNELGLPCSIGIASNKLIAKMATEAGKACAKKPDPPNAITIVPPGDERKFITPLPTSALWGVGPKTAQRLEEMGIKTVGEIAASPESALIRVFGKHGRELVYRSHGIDDRPIITSHEIQSVSQETTFAQDISDEENLRKTLSILTGAVAKRLRDNNLYGVTVKIKIRWPDFTTLTRQITLTQPTNRDSEIISAVTNLFEKVWQKGKKVRLLGVGVSGLKSPARQMGFWETGFEKEHKLLEAIDYLQKRFGKKAIHRGQ